MCLWCFAAEVSTVSLKATPPTSKKSPRFEHKFSKSVDTISNGSMDSEDERVAAVPKIRRFTLADPLMMPVT